MKRLIYVLVLILLCVGLLFGGYLTWRFLQIGEKPVATILSPETPKIINSGDGLAVAVYAQAEAGISRIVLMADGEIYTEESASGENTLTLAFPWYGTSLGSHTLEALVYDSANQVSEPASLLIGVQAKTEPDRMDFVYIPSSEGGDGDAGSGTGSGDGGNASGGVGRIFPVADSAQQQNNLLPSPADGNDTQEIILGEPLSPDEVFALPHAQDSGPIIPSFEASPRRNGQQVQIAYHVEAQDDLGIDRLEFSVQQINGEEYTRTMLCFGETPCVVDDVFPLAGIGTWQMRVVAIDTTGQASTPQLVIIEIMDGGEFAPAILLQEIDGEHPIAFSLHNVEPSIPSLDWTTLLTEGPPENPIRAENNCMRALVEPRTQGNFISLVYVCNEDALSDYHLGWRISVVNSLTGGQREELLDRRFEDLISLNYGQNFAYLHETPLCGTLSTYRIELDWLPDTNENGGRVNSSESIGVIEVMNVPGLPCGPDGLIQDLQALAAPEGAQVSWKFLQDATVTEPLHYWLYRDNLKDILEAEIVEEGFLAEGELLISDVLHTFTDTSSRCGFGAYDYFVVASHSTPEQIDFASTTFNRTPCSSESLENIAIELIPGYSLLDVDSTYYPSETVSQTVTVKSFIPPNPSWAGYEFLTLHLNIDSPDLPENERGERFPLRGNPTSIRITDEIVANGFDFESAVWAKCGGLRWNVAWELLLGGETIESGPVFTVRTAPCLPPPEAAPVITSITSSSDCVSGPACVILTWQPSDYVAPTDPAVEFPMTGIAIYRFTAFAIGRLDALGANPDDITKAQLVYIGTGNIEISLRVPCVPEEANVTYGYSILPMTWTEETHSIYSNAGTTLALIDACKSLPYDAVGTLTLR